MLRSIGSALFVTFLTFACGGTSADRMMATIGAPDAGGGAPASGADPALGEPITGAPTSNDAGSLPACPNVDILFVIDNSGSMTDKQARLAASFPGFADAIQKKLPSAKSVHVGVVSSSDYYAGQKSACLIRKTEGPMSTNAQCLTTTPFLDARDPAFAQRFACVAKVGAGGDDDERPMNAVLGALQPSNNGPGACNAGFIRPDALLVLVLITDEDDIRDSDCDDFLSLGTCGSQGTPDDWYQTVVGIKGGHPENVLVLSLFALDDSCANAPTVNLARFTGKFGERGVIGDVCAPSYAPFFASSLPAFDRACANFVAPK